jgi:hypothetical protein
MLLALMAPALAETTSLFDFLHGLDGKTYPGRMTYPSDSDHEMNKPMQITVQVVSDNEIRIPLQVGQDRSRTWVLTRSDAGVLLKHDHRHADGTPDEVTNYGGLAAKVELGNLLVFPADQETATLLPEASSNAWSLRLSPDASQLFYYLERHAKPRFEAAFDLNSPKP